MLELRWLVDIVKRELPAIRQPTLIVHPREDDRASLRNAGSLQGALGGMVETCVLDDSYHIVTVDRQRDLVVDRTAAFARRFCAPDVHGNESGPMERADAAGVRA
jgi:carboxylesterase